MAKDGGKLTAKQLASLHRRLEEERDRILAVLRSPTLAAGPEDERSEFEETAQRTAEESDRLAVTERERRLLVEVEGALKRIHGGRYGIDEETGAPIPYERLAAVPWARTVGDERAPSSRNEMARVIVITGAAGVLGTALARHLLARGDRVAGVGLPRHGERLRELARELGPAFIGLPLAEDSTAAWDAALAGLERDHGPVAGAALVAGGWRGGKLFHEERDDATWRVMLDENLESAQRALRALLPLLVARRSGSVVVVGSRNVERPWVGTGAAAYTVAKSAVVALARVVASEVQDAGVRVNAVLPSTIDTPQNRRAMPDADALRWVRPESIAAVVEFLLSDAARDVSGAVLPVYGRA